MAFPISLKPYTLYLRPVTIAEKSWIIMGRRLPTGGFAGRLDLRELFVRVACKPQPPAEDAHIAVENGTKHGQKQNQAKPNASDKELPRATRAAAASHVPERDQCQAQHGDEKMIKRLVLRIGRLPDPPNCRCAQHQGWEPLVTHPASRLLIGNCFIYGAHVKLVLCPCFPCALVTILPPNDGVPTLES
jgi:hypothetical protein